MKASKREVHPVAALFPMLSQDELAELAADIKARGQLQPVVLDSEGRVLDGRNREAACEIAGVEPVFETYDGDDPAGYALSVNVQRRSLRPSQQYMIKEMARRLTVVNGSQAKKNLISGSKVERDGLSQAATVLDHAPALAQQVADGNLALNEAVKIAQENKRLAQAEVDKRTHLSEDAPDLLSLVQDDQLSVDDAVAALSARQEKARQETIDRKERARQEAGEKERLARVEAEARQKERLEATQLTCVTVCALARIDGADWAKKYDPGLALEDRKVDLEVIDAALSSLERLKDAWADRGLE